MIEPGHIPSANHYFRKVHLNPFLVAKQSTEEAVFRFLVLTYKGMRPHIPFDYPHQVEVVGDMSYRAKFEEVPGEVIVETDDPTYPVTLFESNRSERARMEYIPFLSYSGRAYVEGEPVMGLFLNGELCAIHATQNPKELIDGLKHIKDLESYEGPLLALFRDPLGTPYVYYWYDVTTEVNRWLVVRIEDRFLELYRAKRLNLFSLMRLTPGPSYLIDIDGKSEVTKIETIPSATDFLDIAVKPKKRPGHHYRPSVVKLRGDANNLCCDDDCELSEGYAHAGPCEPCGCPMNHAIAECPLLGGPW